MRKKFRKSADELINKIDITGTQVAPTPPVVKKEEKPQVKVDQKREQVATAHSPSEEDRKRKTQLTLKISDDVAELIRVGASRININESDFSLLAMIALYRVRPQDILAAKIEATNFSHSPDNQRSIRITLGFKSEIIIKLANEYFDRNMSAALITASIWLATLPLSMAYEMKKKAMEIDIAEGYGIYRLR